MRRTCSIGLLGISLAIILALVVGTGGATRASAQSDGSDRLAGQWVGQAEAISMVLSEDGNPILAFHNAATRGLSVLACTDASCDAPVMPTVVDVPNPDEPGWFRTGLNSSIELGVDGNPVIAYDDGKLRLIRCLDLACSASELLLGPLDNAVMPSLRVDSSDRPVLSYWSTAEFDLAMIRCNDAACATYSDVVVYAEGELGNQSSLALDASDRAVIAFPNRNWSAGVRVARCHDDACTERTIAHQDGWPSAAPPAIDLNSVNNPVVAFPGDLGGSLQLIVCTDSLCDSPVSPVAVVAYDRHSTTYGLDLALDDGDHPVMSFVGGAETDLTVVRCLDSMCAGVVRSDPLEPGAGLRIGTALRLDSGGNPVVASPSWDFSAGPQPGISVAHCADIYCGAQPPDPPASMTASVQLSATSLRECDLPSTVEVTVSGMQPSYGLMFALNHSDGGDFGSVLGEFFVDDDSLTTATVPVEFTQATAGTPGVYELGGLLSFSLSEPGQHEYEALGETSVTIEPCSDGPRIAMVGDSFISGEGLRVQGQLDVLAPSGVAADYECGTDLHDNNYVDRTNVLAHGPWGVFEGSRPCDLVTGLEIDLDQLEAEVDTGLRHVRRNENLCHRSNATHVHRLGEELNAEVVNFACSGAVTADVFDPEDPSGLQGQYENSPPEVYGGSAQLLPLLFRHSEDPFDAVFVSIGGNDLGFGDLIKQCLYFDCSEITTQIEYLSRIPDVENSVVETLRQLRIVVEPAEIFLIGYPTVISRESVQSCSNHWFDLSPTGRIEPDEGEFLATSLLPALNAHLRTAAQRAGVTFVDTSDAFPTLYQICGGETEEAVGVNGLVSGDDPQAEILGVTVVEVGNESFHPTIDGHGLIYGSAGYPRQIGLTPLPAPDDGASCDASNCQAIALTLPQGQKEGCTRTAGVFAPICVETDWFPDANEPTELSLSSCVEAVVTFEVSNSDGVVVREGELTEVGPGDYTGSYADVPGAGSYVVSYVVDCGSGVVLTTREHVLYIDPAGRVSDCSGAPVDDSTVLLLRSESPTGTFVAVPDGSDLMSADNRANPSRTDVNGDYRWDVQPGYYVVEASAPGFNPVRSQVLEIPPPRFNVDLVLGDCDPVCEAASFADVTAGIWFEPAVQWASCRSITSGTSASMFSPGSTLTRAQMATFLWRYAGTPTGAPAHGFADVTPGIWYDDAVAWLASSGITAGTGPGTFSPNDPVTRAQMAVFLHRFSAEPSGAPEHGFSDVEPGIWYEAGVAWMVDQGITQGTGTGSTYSPGVPLTRAQAVTFLWRHANEP